jgi:UDP-N-acetylglucosamine 2-epimerase
MGRIGSVHVVGPRVDQAFRTDLPDRADLATSIGIPLRPPIVVVTVHPATLAVNPAESVGPVIAAMDAVDATYVISGPNADPGSADIRRALEMAATGPRRVLVEALGDRSFWGLLKIADAMLGNSSSGIVEAPALRLPVVNVGDRQAGRARQPNVIDAAADDTAVTSALRRALDGESRRGLPAPDARLLDGHAGERAAHIIAAWRPSYPPRKAPMLVPA